MFKKITATDWKEKLLQSAQDDELRADISRAVLAVFEEFKGQLLDWRKEKKLVASLSEKLGGRKVWIEECARSHKSIRVEMEGQDSFNLLLYYFSNPCVDRAPQRHCPLATWIKWGERGAVKRAAVKDVAKRMAKIEKAWATLYAEAQALDALDVKNDCFDDSQMRKHMSQLFY